MTTNLYDRTGRPVAYIADDEESIYLWDGQAVAYLYDDKVYGWNGRHLGSWDNGILRDQSGRRVGFTADRCPVARHAAPAKPTRSARPARSARQAASARPAASTALSALSLTDFLAAGR